MKSGAVLGASGVVGGLLGVKAPEKEYVGEAFAVSCKCGAVFERVVDGWQQIRNHTKKCEMGEDQLLTPHNDPEEFAAWQEEIERNEDPLRPDGP